MKRVLTSFEHSNFISYIYIPASLIFYEVVLFFMAGCVFNVGNFIAMILLSVGTGMLLNILVSLTRSEKANAWIAFLIIELIAIIFMIAYFVQATYQNFTNIATVFGGAGGIVEEFASSIWGVITHNVGRILLYEIPSLLFIPLGLIFKVIRYRRNMPKAYLWILLTFVVLCACGCGLFFRSKTNRERLTAQYDFNTVVRCFGLQTGLNLDLFYLIAGNPNGCVFTVADDSDYMSGSSDYTDGNSYPKHEMGIDYEQLALETTDKNLRNMHSYVASLSPASENAYTGLFEGKNLIFFTVEAMSSEMISEDLTPTLYRMQQNGIRFTDYYQPYFNGSTSTGELANLTGLIPSDGMDSYKSTIGKNMYFTMGNRLKAQDYFSRAYHNGTVDYYDRNIVHPNLGYDEFIAIGNGMESGLSDTWPTSDMEMVQYAEKQFLTEAPFNIYFMTISGHFPYFHDISVMVDKYGDRTEGHGFSDFLDAYICSEIDVEEALKDLLENLKAAGEYENTVIVLAPDHYPYGLTKNDAWGAEKDYLAELYGSYPKDMMERDHNSLIIWSPCMEEMEPVVVSEPSYSVDILPTLLNLYGISYDSRLLVGRDVLSQTSGLVIWPDYSWRTLRGTYYALEDRFVSTDGAEADPAYVENMKNIVRNKILFSRNVLKQDYYELLFGNES